MLSLLEICFLKLSKKDYQKLNTCLACYAEQSMAILDFKRSFSQFMAYPVVII